MIVGEIKAEEINIKVEEIFFQLYNPILQFEDVKKIWINLLAKCPHSFYLSWGWIEVWLKRLPTDSNLSLVVGFKGKKPLIAFFIGSQKKFRRGIFRVRRISLNSTLSKVTDELCEYNAILVDPKITLSLETLIQQMPVKKWDEFYFPRIALNHCPNFHFKINSHKKYILEKQDLVSYYVDLKKVRGAEMDYLSLLSSRRRNRLRKSIQEYKKIGEIKVTIANTEDEAFLMLEELIKLHQKIWVQRGEPGVFSSAYFCDFHGNLISSRFSKNEIQFLKVSCGHQTIGYLYSIIFNGQVLGYQGGFNYHPKTVYLPGMTCHYFAILHNAVKGLDTYNFGTGEAHYKKTLSTDSAMMQNILLQKKKLKFAIENKLKQIYSSTQNLKAKLLNNVT